MLNETFDYVDYLAAKKAVDDNSLNPAVWAELGQWLLDSQRGRGLDILEIGAGVGTMIERLLEAGFLGSCHYTVVEQEPGFAEAACARLAAWCVEHDVAFHQASERRWHLTGVSGKVEIHWLTADALQVGTMFEAESFDLLIGHALIDLLPVPRYLPEALRVLKPNGVYYFSLNFAGATRFTPEDPRDQTFTEAYHADMDKRFPELDWLPSRTGEALGPWLRGAGYAVLAEGDSDWNVTAGSNPGSAGFIRNILDTMAKTLAGTPGLDAWLFDRRGQLAAGTLTLFISNRDVLGSLPLAEEPGRHSPKAPAGTATA